MPSIRPVNYLSEEGKLKQCLKSAELQMLPVVQSCKILKAKKKAWGTKIATVDMHRKPYRRLSRGGGDASVKHPDNIKRKDEVRKFKVVTAETHPSERRSKMRIIVAWKGC